MQPAHPSPQYAVIGSQRLGAGSPAVWEGRSRSRHMAVSGTSWTLLANGSVRSSPMLSTARKTSPISVDPIGVARPKDRPARSGAGCRTRA
jgi:hypothetical protein